MKRALLLPGYLDSPDYTHLRTFERGLISHGYVVERLDLCNLWSTGDTSSYSISHALTQISQRIEFYASHPLDEVLLLGHSRGGLIALLAGARHPEVTQIIALCPPPYIASSKNKWENDWRKSKRDIPPECTLFREFDIPLSYVNDAIHYSGVDAVASIYKPLMIFIALDDTTVLPEKTELLVSAAHNPYVVRVSNISHDFRRSQEACDIVMEKISAFLTTQAL